MIKYDIKTSPTDIFGLKFRPSIEPEVSDDCDYPKELIDSHGFTAHTNPTSASKANTEVLEGIFFKKKKKSILEIGVQTKKNIVSLTRTLRVMKSADTKILSIDIDFRRQWTDWENNIWTSRINSFNQGGVRDRIERLEMGKLDLILIDGFHSVNSIINDWKYCDLLSDKGTVVIHDTNANQCKVILEEIDEDIFEINSYCQSLDDWGIAVCKKK